MDNAVLGVCGALGLFLLCVAATAQVHEPKRVRPHACWLDVEMRIKRPC